MKKGLRIERAIKRWVTFKLRHHTKIMLNESAKMLEHGIKMISKDKKAFWGQTFENIILFCMPLIGSKILCNVTVSWFYLPDTVTHPSSLITWGWGLSFFRTSSSDSKSFLSAIAPSPRFFYAKGKKKTAIKLSKHFRNFIYI